MSDKVPLIIGRTFRCLCGNVFKAKSGEYEPVVANNSVIVGYRCRCPKCGRTDFYHRNETEFFAKPS